MKTDRISGSHSRDVRLDVLRGFACVSFVVAHIEAFSWFHMLFWERLGFISGAEIFIIVSGFLIGRIHRDILESPDGANRSTGKLWRRALTLYCASFVATWITLVLSKYFPIDMSALTTFTDRVSGRIYPLFPPTDAGWPRLLHDALMLRVGPHQLQVLGLYMVVLIASPFVLMLLRRGHTLPCLGLSLSLWAIHRATGTKLTSTEFEAGFPLLGWQIYFFVALVAGWHRDTIAAWLEDRSKLKRVMTAGIVLVAIVFMVFAQATANPNFPPGTRLPLVDENSSRQIYTAFFDKNSVAPGRLVSAPCFVLTVYVLLGKLNARTFAFLSDVLAPLGEASLYVFLTHILFIMAIDQLPGYFDRSIGYSPETVWINTGLVFAVLVSLWTMVRCRALYWLIPR